MEGELETKAIGKTGNVLYKWRKKGHLHATIERCSAIDGGYLGMGKVRFDGET